MRRRRRSPSPWRSDAPAPRRPDAPAPRRPGAPAPRRPGAPAPRRPGVARAATGSAMPGNRVRDIARAELFDVLGREFQVDGRDRVGEMGGLGDADDG